MTVKELLCRMSSEELAEWEVWYNHFEPFGEYRMDLRAGGVAAPLLNIIRAAFGVSDRAKIGDWVMEFGKSKQAQRQDPKQMKAMLGAFARAMQNQEDRKPQRGKLPPPRKR